MQCEANYYPVSKHVFSASSSHSWRSDSWVPEIRPSRDSVSRTVGSSFHYPRPVPSQATERVLPSYSLSQPFSTTSRMAYPPARSLATSEAYPIMSPQLEDRMLQLADRSRRLGVHRFSRTRQSLVLNTPPAEVSYISYPVRHSTAAGKPCLNLPTSYPFRE